jgi:hypothetical protein
VSLPARGLAAVLVAAAIVAPLACLEPTQVHLRFTSRDCSSFDRVEIRLGEEGSETRAVLERKDIAAAACAQPGGGLLGTLFVRQGANRSVHVRATAMRAGADCAKDAASCIVATRTVTFAPHRSLELPISLDPECFGVVCPMGQTCKAAAEGGRAVGRCMDEVVACTEKSCDTPVDAGADALPPPPPDAATDAPPPDAGVCPRIAPETKWPLAALWTFDGPPGSSTVMETISSTPTTLVGPQLVAGALAQACGTSLALASAAGPLLGEQLAGKSVFAVGLHVYAPKLYNGPLVEKMNRKGFYAGWNLSLDGLGNVVLGACQSVCDTIVSAPFEAGWHDVLLVHDGTVTSLSVDGSPVSTKGWTPSNPASPLTVAIGNGPRIDELRIYYP